MAEILHFEILRKHGQTHKQTHKQTDMGITIPRPPPMGGEVIIKTVSKIFRVNQCQKLIYQLLKFLLDNYFNILRFHCMYLAKY